MVYLANRKCRQGLRRAVASAQSAHLDERMDRCPQGLKPVIFVGAFASRLKSRPFKVGIAGYGAAKAPTDLKLVMAQLKPCSFKAGVAAYGMVKAVPFKAALMDLVPAIPADPTPQVSQVKKMKRGLHV